MKTKSQGMQEQMRFTFGAGADSMPVPQPEVEEMTVTLDREVWDCLRQCMSADRSVLEEELAWPDWMVTDVVEKLALEIPES